MKSPQFLRKMFGKLRHFGRSERGMTLPLLAVSMVAITGMVGLAIDTARAQLVQSKLQFSLDAAGLAAGATVSTASINSEMTKYLGANFNGYLGSTLTGSSVAPNATNTVFTLSATATLPTTFMGVVGVNTITVHANSQISRAVTGLELVFVLDNTGSMANSAGQGVSKIQALQTAASTLVTSLFAGNPPAGKLWVGIVPFSQAVNIGTGHPTWMNTTYDSGLDWGPSPSAWAGCVDARRNGEDVTDDPPSNTNINTLFDAYNWVSDNLNPDGVINSGTNQWKFPQFNKCVTTYNRCKNGTCTLSSPTCSTSNGHTCTLIAPTCSVVTSCSSSSTTTCTALGTYSYSSPLDQLNQGPNLLCPQQVTMMTNVQSTLTTAINAMTPQGDTLINQGLEWGWNMLSPRWRGQWGGTMGANNLPLDYNTPGMSKAVVLVTDGANTIDNGSHGAYWFVGDNWLGTTNSSAGTTALDTRTLQLCTAMKNAGIYIYTIAVGTDVTTSAKTMLQSCATSSNYYFNSPSTAQLSGIFSTISDSLSNLRVSQ
jgi:Flp pilus assembly protein TadG